MKVLFLDCFSGISGDMTVGALCDLGVKPSTLEWELSKVALGDFHMHFERAQRKNIEGVKFGIHEGATHTHDQDEGADHDHDHDHHHHEGHEHSHADDHGHTHQHAHPHPQDHDHGDETEHAKAFAHEAGHSHTEEHGHPEHAVHGHSHEPGDGHSEPHEHSHQEEHSSGHDHGHGHHGHEHHHDEHCHEHGHHHHAHEHAHGRNHAEIRQLIQDSDLSLFVKEHALGIFQRIAVAEGKIHGVPPAEVGFHEVGALDSIADIICVCVGIEALGVDEVHVSALHDGRGWVECAHGTFPLPAPATLEILAGIPVAQIDEPHELITPTGAAIVAEFGKSFGLMPRLKTEKVGYGIGSRELASRPNVLRAVLGELVEE